MAKYNKSDVTGSYMTDTALAKNSKDLLTKILETGHDYVDAKIEIPTFEYNDEGIFNEFMEGLFDEPIDKLTNGSLTNSDGTGTFDILANKVKDLLHGEYEENRITGAEYTKAFQALVGEALGQSVQFALNKELQQYEAAKLKLGAINSMYQSMATKASVAQVQYKAESEKINFLRNKLQTNKDLIELNAAKANLELLLPVQLNLEDAKVGLIEAQTRNAKVQDLLYKQQIESFRLRDLSQSMAIVQSAFSTQYMANENATEPFNLANRDINGNATGSLQSQLTTYVTAAQALIDEKIDLDNL